MHRSSICLAILFSTVALAPDAKAAPTLIEHWTLTGLDAPESIAFDPTAGVLYVSNVHGEGAAQDGNGYLSRVSPAGKLVQQRWVEGLDGPKGLALRDGRLYVADIDELVVVDVAAGSILSRHAAEGAKFLNDVLDAGSEGILISDSANARIYRWRDERMETWLEHAELGSVNGLLREGDRVIVSTMQGKLLAIELASRTVKVLAEGLGNGDGIVALGGGRYLVGEWPGRLFVVAADGSHEVLLDSRAEKRFINDFLAIAAPEGAGHDGGQLLLVPNWEPGSITAYRLQP